MRLKYAFIAKHQSIYSVVRMCRVLRLHPSGYYAWRAKPQSHRAIDDQRLLGLLKQAWLESGGVYGYRKLTLEVDSTGRRNTK